MVVSRDGRARTPAETIVVVLWALRTMWRNLKDMVFRPQTQKKVTHALWWEVSRAGKSSNRRRICRAWGREVGMR